MRYRVALAMLLLGSGLAARAQHGMAAHPVFAARPAMPAWSARPAFPGVVRAPAYGRYIGRPLSPPNGYNYPPHTPLTHFRPPYLGIGSSFVPAITVYPYGFAYGDTPADGYSPGPDETAPGNIAATSPADGNAQPAWQDSQAGAGPPSGPTPMQPPQSYPPDATAGPQAYGPQSSYMGAPDYNVEPANPAQPQASAQPPMMLVPLVPVQSPAAGMTPDVVTIIYKDGRPPLQVQNYILTRSALYITGQHFYEVPLSDIDLQATQRVNWDAGVKFSLP